MKKKALYKDIRQEIKKTLPRFLSIFMMSALGVSFFSGVRAAMPDMLSTTDRYLKESNLFDLQIKSTMGLQKEDLKAVLNTEGVRDAELGYSADLFCDKEGEQYVVHLMSAGTMAKCEVSQGRMPRKENEIFLDEDLAEKLGYDLGDTITLYGESGEENGMDLKNEDYTVTGIGTSPIYLSMNRGSTSIGNGEVSGFAVVQPEAFDMDVYTLMNVQLEETEAVSSYSDEYKEAVRRVKDTLEETGQTQCEWRYEEIYREGSREIEKAQEQLDQKKDDAEEQLKNGRIQLDAGWEQIRTGEEKLESGKKTLVDSETQLTSREAELRQSQEQLNAAKRQIQEGTEQVEAGRREAESKAAKLSEAEQELMTQEDRLSDWKKSLEQGYSELEENRQLVVGMQAELEQKKQELTDAWQIWQNERNRITEELTETSRRQEELEDTLTGLKAELEALIQAGVDVDDPRYQELSAEISSAEEELSQIQQATADLKAQEEALGIREAELNEWEAKLVVYEQQTTAQIEAAMAEIEAAQIQLLEQEKAFALAYEAFEAVKAETIPQIEAGQKQMESVLAMLEGKAKELDEAAKQTAASQIQINSGKEQMEAARVQLDTAKDELFRQQALLEQARTKAEEGEDQYRKSVQMAEIQIRDAQEQIGDARDTLRGLEKPKWYVSEREDVVEDYSEMEDNAEQIGAIGKVFPLMFFLVAALVSLTTMTRMVEEQRGHIGTMKALGYGRRDIASKYLLYAGSATFGGGIVGILVGQKLFPYIIQISYGIMYDCLNRPQIPYRFLSAFQALAISVVCIMTATAVSCLRELREVPAELMRPEAPKAGKRVLLEYIPPIWKHLNFTTKSTFRNLFRYKKRLFMTIFGISSTMALLVTGFGLRDSIIDLAEIQYGRIQLQDAMITLNGTEEEKKELDQWLQKQKEIQASTMVHMELLDAKTDEGTGEVYLCVPRYKEDFQTMTILKNRQSGESYELGENGVLLTEWMSDTLKVEKGDTITLQNEGGDAKEVVVEGIVENYIMNYVYMSADLYRQIYGEPAEYEVIYTELTEEGLAHEHEIGSEILKQPGVYNVSYISDTRKEIDDMLQALVMVVIVLIVTAALLAYVVLYNLNNVNITERRRELATLKVLGFHDKEVADYVYHENIILTLVGIVAGVFLGIVLHQYIIHTIRVDMVMFGQRVSLISFGISAVLTAVFSGFVNFVMYFKLKEIDMVESLKSVE